MADLSDLDTVSIALDTIETLHLEQALKPSFGEWRASIKDYRFDNKECFELEDLDFILDMIASNAGNSDWINTRYGYSASATTQNPICVQQC